MARQINRLTARTVATLSKTGRHADGGGLYLSISANGGRRWVFLYRWQSKPTEMGLGSARDVSLARARELAAQARAGLAEGINPMTIRTKAAVPTFGDCADAVIKAMRPSWRNEKHADQWLMTLKVHAAPLRPIAVNEIETADILKVLKPIWQTKSETASRLRGRIERVLDAAKAEGFRVGENPARWRGHMDQLLPKRQKLTRGHHKALPYEQMPAFMVDLRGREALAASALEFVILTAARSGEVLNADWAEIDLRRGTWTVPAKRMKAGREHRVPLSERAIELLTSIRPDDGKGYVFPGQKLGRPLSSMAMEMVLRRLKVDATIHGFRSTFRDWAAETTPFANEVCEAALAHVIRDASEAAYRRGDLFEKRRALMEAWCQFAGASNRSAELSFVEAA